VLLYRVQYEKHVQECKRVNASLLKKKQAAAATSGGAAAAKPRSKVPESVLARMEAAAGGASVADRLGKRLGSPCDACGAAAAVVVCVGCHAVYCQACSDSIHTADTGLAEHKPMRKEVWPLD
jgi:hypothetical protein